MRRTKRRDVGFHLRQVRAVKAGRFWADLAQQPLPEGKLPSGKVLSEPLIQRQSPNGGACKVAWHVGMLDEATDPMSRALDSEQARTMQQRVADLELPVLPDAQIPEPPDAPGPRNVRGPFLPSSRALKRTIARRPDRQPVHPICANVADQREH